MYIVGVGWSGTDLFAMSRRLMGFVSIVSSAVVSLSVVWVIRCVLF